MTIERKLLSTSPSGGATDVADVFSTFLYKGTGGALTVNNGIDLAGEGGMVWVKCRDGSEFHYVSDTERGVRNILNTDRTVAQFDQGGDFNHNSNGFSFNTASGNLNQSNKTYASWTFRNSKKFFKAVTFSYGGSSSSPTVVTHNLGCTVGMTFVKQTNGTQNWHVQHKNVTGNDNNGALNLTIAFAGGNGQSTSFTSITDTQATFGAAASFPAGTYVAYFFADNSSEDAEEQMIKCGSYTGTGSDLDVNLGWEPQFLLIKNSTSAADWYIVDTMRGFTATTLSNELVNPNSANAESKVGNVVYDQYLTSTGFRMLANASEFNANGQTYIYMAIRAPMMVEPEATTDVFSVKSYTGNGSTQTLDAAFGPVDMAIVKNKESGVSMQPDLTTRLTHAEIYTDSNAEEGSRNFVTFDSNSLLLPAQNNSNTSNIPFSLFSWKRAKGFMDCVAYSGTGSARTIPHSLGVAPEMIWAKKRNNSRDWGTGFASQGWTKRGPALDQNETSYVTSVLWNDTAPTDSVFSVSGLTHINGSGDTYIAYLFATLAGISKVGSYTGNGSNQTINCGFAAGARFILIKRTDAAGNWYVWDSLKGIVAGNDPHFQLNTTAVDVTNDDSVDPHNSGFIVNQVSATNINVSSDTYIFYAIA